jgi:hypothetical protein
VADAFIGMHGLNGRKGICRNRDDLLAELADVIITAAVAMIGITGDVDEAQSHLERRLATVTARAPSTTTPPSAGLRWRKSPSPGAAPTAT